MEQKYNSIDEMPPEVKHAFTAQLQLAFWAVLFAVGALVMFIVFSPFFWVRYSRTILSAPRYPFRRLIWSLGSKHDLAWRLLEDFPSLMKDIWTKNY
jgi:hypothetical protein